MWRRCGTSSAKDCTPTLRSSSRSLVGLRTVGPMPRRIGAAQSVEAVQSVRQRARIEAGTPLRPPMERNLQDRSLGIAVEILADQRFGSQTMTEQPRRRLVELEPHVDLREILAIQRLRRSLSDMPIQRRAAEIRLDIGSTPRSTSAPPPKVLRREIEVYDILHSGCRGSAAPVT